MWLISFRFTTFSINKYSTYRRAHGTTGLFKDGIWRRTSVPGWSSCALGPISSPESPHRGLLRGQRRSCPVRLPMHLISCCEGRVERLMPFETSGHFLKVLAASCFFLYGHSTRVLAPIWQLSFPFMVELGPLAAHDSSCHPWYRVESRLVAVTPLQIKHAIHHP